MNTYNTGENYTINKFNLHNKRLFSKIKKNRKKIFLIEFNGWPVFHIIFSYLVNYFKNEKRCKIVAYECFDLLNRIEPSWYKKCFWKIGSILNLKTFKIFKSFGTDQFIKPYFSEKIIFEASKITKAFISKKPQLKDLENLKIKGVWIGDLIYDSYLKKNSLSTIEINSNNFIKFFRDSIKLYLFWEEFFKKNDIEAICVCHAVYLTGIPLRIANNKNVSCFSMSNMNLVNLTKSISYKNKINGSNIQFKHYKKIFNKFPKKLQKKYLIKGKKILNDFTSGEKKYFYLKNTTFNKKIVKNKKNKNSKIKVAIFSHNFTDSPHVYGNHFFTDFKQWFKFLDKIIKQTNYEWFIKDHPSFNYVTKKEIYSLIRNNKNLKLISKNFPNNQLAKLGIKFVLTIYGSVASELSPFGIKVINASKNNPHFDYNFCINPQNLNQYKRILLNLRKIKNKFKIDELYSFHFMKNLAFKCNFFFKKTDKYFKFLNGKPLQYTYKTYEYWINDFNLEMHNDIVRNIKKFITSKNYLFLEIKDEFINKN